MPPLDVFVTGIGIVSPAGGSTDTTWQNLLAGERAVRPLIGCNLPGGLANFGGQVPCSNSREPMTTASERAQRFADMAAREAVEHANWDGPVPAICYGYSKPILNRVGDLFSPSDKYPDAWFPGIPSLPTTVELAPNGIVHVTVAACSTGTLSVIRGAQLIQDGHADAVLCVVADASIEPLWLSAYRSLGVLAQSHPERGPGWACRPFDRTRSGFAVGEGAGGLFLESAESVHKRGISPLARLSGYAVGADPTGLTQLDPAAMPLTRVFKLALERAQRSPGDVVLTVTHGTATQANDLSEILALRSLLGNRMADTPVVSFKGAIGHMLGAAGAVELALAVQAIKSRQCPGNNTLIEKDPSLGDCVVPQESFELSKGAVLKTSLGFGGHLAAVVLEA